MLTVADLMSNDVFTLRETDTLKTARSMMSLARIRHIPVVDNGMHFQGLLTHRDILGASISQFADIDSATRDEIDAGIPLAEIMRTDVTTVTSDMPLREGRRAAAQPQVRLPARAAQGLPGRDHHRGRLPQADHPAHGGHGAGIAKRRLAAPPRPTRP